MPTTINEVYKDKQTVLTRIVYEHIKNSQRSGNTLDSAHFDTYLTNTVNEVAKSISSLSTNDTNVVINMLINHANVKLKEQYRESLKANPRTPNNKKPKNVTDAWLKDARKISGQVRKDMRSKANLVLKQSIMTNHTPKRDQFIYYLKGQLAELIEGQPDDVQDYINAYTTKWIEQSAGEIYDNNLKAHPREITSDFPWSRNTGAGKTSSGGNTPSTISGSKAGNNTSTDTSFQGSMSVYGNTYTSFSGHDMVCTIDMPMPDGSNIIKVIGVIQTLTYSIHDEKFPIRCVGDMNAKGYVFGPRTIAGTLIFSVFDKHWALKIMDEYLANKGVSAHFLADELPPFNITISCANEYGHDARLALYGITLVNEGQVMSIHDVYTENTYDFFALDVDYLSDVTTKSASSTKNKKDLPEIDDSRKGKPRVVALGDATTETKQPRNNDLVKDVGSSTDPDKPFNRDYKYYPSTPKEIMYSEIEDSKNKTDDDILAKYNKGDINEQEFHRLRRKNQENSEKRMKDAEHWYSNQEKALDYNKVSPDDSEAVRKAKEAAQAKSEKG